jgi:hypothetical protein
MEPPAPTPKGEQDPRWSVDRRTPFPTAYEKRPLFFGVAAVLCVCWVVGLQTTSQFSGLIHILPFAAAVLFLIGLFEGPRHHRGPPHDSPPTQPS